MREIALGQYYQTSSIVHSTDARVKLLISIAYLVMVFFVGTYIGFGVLAVCFLLTVFASRVPLFKVLKSLKVILFLAFFTFLMTMLFYGGAKKTVVWEWWIIKIYEGQLYACGLVLLRLVFLVLGPTMLTFTTTPVELTDGLEWLLKPLALIGIPIHSGALVMSMTLRIIPNLIDETDRIINAQKSRCADFDSRNIFKRAKAMIPILVPLIASSFRKADELADAMDSRCFVGAKNRTRMRKLRFTWRDPIALILFAAEFTVILWLKFNFFPFVDLSAVGWIV